MLLVSRVKVWPKTSILIQAVFFRYEDDYIAGTPGLFEKSGQV